MATHDLLSEGDRPDDDSFAFFEKTLTGHSAVRQFERMPAEGQYYNMHRTRDDTLLVYLSDLYTIGEADYLQMIGEDPNIDCIVTASGYNSYTADAKTRAVAGRVGLFNIREFLGAINRERFWEYTSPPPDKSARTKRRSA